MGNNSKKEGIALKVALSTRWSNTFVYITARFLVLAPAAWPCPGSNRIAEIACLISFHPPDINNLNIVHDLDLQLY